MKRSHVLLSALAAVLLVAVFWMLLFNPAREEVAELELAIADEQVQQQGLQQEIARLRAVRDEAPEVEAELVAGEAIVPREASLPTALRQLQLAADESGAILQAVTTSRPVALELEEETGGLSAIQVEVQVLGGYFQVVDFLRRVEDPVISPRGLNWLNATLARGEEYPELTAALTGEIYAVIAVPVPPEMEPDPDAPTTEGDETDEADPDETEDDEDADADVEVDVEVDADVAVDADGEDGS